MLLSMSITKSANSGVELQRPLEERQVPEAIDFSVDGRELRCFDRDGWEQVAHIIIDYRAFFGWADRMELTLLIERKTNAVLEEKLVKTREIYQMSRDANHMMLSQIDLYQQEAKDNRKKMVWSLVGHAVGLVALGVLGVVFVVQR